MKLKYYKNVAPFIDADYLKKLNTEEKEYYLKFLDEFYCGGQYKPDTLHGKAGIENFKSDLNKMSKARRRDVFAGGCKFEEKKIYENEEHSEIEPWDLAKIEKQPEEKDMDHFLKDKVIEFLDEIRQCETKEEEKQLTFEAFKEVCVWFSKELNRVKREKNKKKYENNKKKKAQ